MRKCALVVFAVVVLLAGCGGGAKPVVPTSLAVKKPDTSNIRIEGDPSTPVNELAIEAVADLQTFWADQFPKLYGEDYKPVEGGLYALTPESESGPACASSYEDVAGNAFYCKLDDSVAWDATGLLPDLQKKYGEFVIPVVLAHEWGHAMQERSGFFDQNELTVAPNCRPTASPGPVEACPGREGLRRRQRRSRQRPGGHPRPAGLARHQRAGPVRARQRLRPRQRLPGWL